MYHGVEAEGRLKGIPTLFSKIPCTEAVEFAFKIPVTHVFFGVRGHELTAEDFEALEKLLYGSIPAAWIVSIQVALARYHAIPAWAFDRCHILLYGPLPMAQNLRLDIEVKLEDQKFAAIYTNPQILDLTYVRDKELK